MAYSLLARLETCKTRNLSAFILCLRPSKFARTKKNPMKHQSVVLQIVRIAQTIILPSTSVT